MASSVVLGYGYSGGIIAMFPTEGGGGGGTPPVITPITPLDGGPLAPTTAIRFSIASAVTYRVLMVVARFPDSLGFEELVHDGSSFVAPYRGVVNVRTGTGNPYTYTVLRDGGWSEAVNIDIFAVDVNGNLAAV